jgi:hypothetical protein
MPPAASPHDSDVSIATAIKIAIAATAADLIAFLPFTVPPSRCSVP